VADALKLISEAICGERLTEFSNEERLVTGFGERRCLKTPEQPIRYQHSSREGIGVFEEFETNLRKERQLEGIAKAKASSTKT
jgi:hypothetical protein